MASATQCLEQIDKVLDAADDPGAAYLIRSRLRRATLSCVRMTADSVGQRPPRTLRILGLRDLDDALDADGREILRRCRRVQAIAAQLCQPSESFDVRWETGWAELRQELDGLRAAITESGMVSVR